MSPLPLRRGRATFVSLVVTTVLAALLSAPSSQASPPAPDAGKAASGSSAAAREALARVQSVFAGSPVAARRSSSSPDPVQDDATMALRDLMVLKSELSGAERAAAEAYLARPTDPSDGDSFTVEYSVAEETPVCNTKICVHYVATTADAPPLADLDENFVPDYIDTMLATMTQVHDTYVGAGYRAPKPDGTKGGNALRDIYVADIGGQGLYGYCTSDQNVPRQGPFDVWAYCVLDDDYSPSQFSSNTPLGNLKVTAAHEYFHAVQFAYDAFEDAWFLESTATWAEDELFDGVDDNVQYLRTSPLTRPRTPVDSSDGIGVYGSWIFIRYLTERFPASSGGLPTLVRDVLRKLDGSQGGPDQYSWQGIATVLKQRGTTATKMMASFADGNRRPGKTYSEGAANEYPTPRLVDQTALGQGAVSAGLRLNHLTSGTYRLSPRRVLGAAAWKLRVALDLAPTSRGSAAVVTTYFRSGAVRTNLAKLDRQGDGSLAVSFSQKKVKYVEVTLVNGSGRFVNCYRGGRYSCQGDSRDDRLLAQFTARAFR